MTALGNFTHRFRDAIMWGERAAAAYPVDTEVTALRVEAHLGLGERDEAAVLLAAAAADTARDFHLAVAHGLWLAESAAAPEAAAAFTRAAALARAGGGDELVAWAEVSAAGVWIDAGEAERAVPHLAAARSLRPDDRRLRVHEAELLGGRGEVEAALAAYETLVADVDDPEIHRRAALLARDLGRRHDAEAHRAAAAAGFRRALAAGEVYTLEGLARLYADHGVHLAEAVSLSARNLEYKRDRHALATDAYVRAAFDAGRRPDHLRPEAGAAGPRGGRRQDEERRAEVRRRRRQDPPGVPGDQTSAP